MHTGWNFHMNDNKLIFHRYKIYKYIYIPTYLYIMYKSYQIQSLWRDANLEYQKYSCNLRIEIKPEVSPSNFQLFVHRN